MFLTHLQVFSSCPCCHACPARLFHPSGAFLALPCTVLSQIDWFFLGPIGGPIGDVRRGGLVDTQVGSEAGGTEGANGLSPMGGKGRDGSRGGGQGSS